MLTDDFRKLPLAIQIQLAVISPLLAGAICGFLLGISDAAYWGWQVVAGLGGIGGGSEHPRLGHGALRGVLAGTIFGMGLLVAHEASGDRALAALPSPAILVVVLTACGGTLAGLIGASLSGRLHGARVA